MSPQEHLHTYVRVRLPKRKDIFMCNGTKCSHRINAAYLVGKAAACFYCGKEFIIERKTLRKQAKLHCSLCGRGKNPDLAHEVRTREKMLENALLKEFEKVNIEEIPSE